MKTGLVTLYQMYHHGALLQAVAMERAVESLGSDCELLDYFSQRSALSGAKGHQKAQQLREHRFRQFAERQLRISGHQFESPEELGDTLLPYDLILIGGDRVWNPALTPDGRFDPVFFGTFSDIRKAAYGASFDASVVPEKLEGDLQTVLGGFSHVAVRKQQDQALVRELTGREAQMVLDPTLLLTPGQWAAMSNPSYLTEKHLAPGGYLLCCCKGEPRALAPYIRQLARRTGLPVVQLCGTTRRVHPKAQLLQDAGPAEFLSLCAGAAWVLTDSFHGALLATLFHKPFFTEGTEADMLAPERSHLFATLELLGLADRIVGQGSTAGLDEAADWEQVDRRLQNAREQSLGYLSAALRGDLWQAREIREKPELPELADHLHCSGCTACASACPVDAITMKRDQEGFSYPVVNREICIRCGKCSAACQVLHPLEKQPMPAVYCVWNRDEKIRKDSASGGAFSAIADYVLEGGGVVFGAVFDAHEHAHHAPCFRKEDLWRLRGSKYVQSELDTTFREIREALKQRQVLFTGTPCQVDGLYRFLGERPENLITADLVCYGVPSPGVWEDMARLIERRKGKEIQAVRFRNKVTTWQDSHFTVVFSDGSVDTAPVWKTDFGHAYEKALFIRPSCYRCPYSSMTRPGDFTLGDLWGMAPDELPEQQDRGISLLSVNTPHGSHIFDQLTMVRKPYPAERAIAGNQALSAPNRQNPDRAAFFAAYALEPFDQVCKEFLKQPGLPERALNSLLEKLKK